MSHSQTLLDNAAHSEWQCHASVVGNRAEKHYRISIIIGHTSLINNCHFREKFLHSLSKRYLIQQLLCHSW